MTCKRTCLNKKTKKTANAVFFLPFFPFDEPVCRYVEKIRVAGLSFFYSEKIVCRYVEKQRQLYRHLDVGQSVASFILCYRAFVNIQCTRQLLLRQVPFFTQFLDYFSYLHMLTVCHFLSGLFIFLAFCQQYAFFPFAKNASISFTFDFYCGILPLNLKTPKCVDERHGLFFAGSQRADVWCESVAP